MTRLPAAADELHADRARALEHDPAHRGPRLDPEVRQVVTVEVRHRGAVPQTVVGALLEDAHALLGLAVVVVDLRHAGGVAECLHELQRGRREVLLARDLDRAVGAAEVVRTALPGLQALEAREHVVEAPALVALGGPVVVVLGVAAHEEHPVDRARAAEHLAAGLRDPAPERVLLGRGVEAPVQALLQLRDVVEDRDHAGLADEARLVDRAGLEEHHARAGLGKAAGHDAAGAPGPDDDVVGRLCRAHHTQPRSLTTAGRAVPPLIASNCNAF